MSLRKSVRERVGEILRARLVQPGKPCQAVYEYQKERLKGVTPCIVVISEPTEIDSTTMESPYVYVHIGIHVFTRYEIVGSGTVDVPEYDERDSEDDMDSMADDVRLAIRPYTEQTNLEDPVWIRAELRQSQIDSYTDLEGLEFRHEYFPFVAECLENE